MKIEPFCKRYVARTVPAIIAAVELFRMVEEVGSELTVNEQSSRGRAHWNGNPMNSTFKILVDGVVVYEGVAIKAGFRQQLTGPKIREIIHNIANPKV